MSQPSKGAPLFVLRRLAWHRTIRAHKLLSKERSTDMPPLSHEVVYCPICPDVSKRFREAVALLDGVERVSSEGVERVSSEEVFDRIGLPRIELTPAAAERIKVSIKQIGRTATTARFLAHRSNRARVY